jgi:hypothetical protein
LKFFFKSNSTIAARTVLRSPHVSERLSTAPPYTVVQGPPVSHPTLPCLGVDRAPTCTARPSAPQSGRGPPPPHATAWCPSPTAPPPLPHPASALKRRRLSTSLPFLSASFPPTSERAIASPFVPGPVVPVLSVGNQSPRQFRSRHRHHRLRSVSRDSAPPFSNWGRTLISRLPLAAAKDLEVHWSHLSSPAPRRNAAIEAAPPPTVDEPPR